MKNYIKDFMITDKNFLSANLTIDSYFGEALIHFSSNFSMPFNNLKNLQETRMTVRLNGTKIKVRLERRDGDKLVIYFDFADPYMISDDDEISVKFSQQDTFISKSSGLGLKLESLYLKTKLKQQLNSNRFFILRDEAKKAVKAALIVVLILPSGTLKM
jgi:hypothetical protein